MNRNYPLYFELETNSSSKIPCGNSTEAYQFKGFEDGDSLEVANLMAFSRAIGETNAGGIKWFFEFHSYASAILIVWKYSVGASIPLVESPSHRAMTPLPETEAHQRTTANGTS